MIGLLALAAAAAAQQTTVLTIDPSHQLVEGVASDGSTIWVSSILDRKILACRAECKTLATLPAGLHPFALAWDSSRRRLWVAADCPSGVPGIKACERGALIALNASGKVLTRIAPASGTFHPGDVSAAVGGVFVSDSQNGAVYRLALNGYSITPVINPGAGDSAQGSAIDEQGQKLVIADYSKGVGVVDLATNTRTILAHEDGRPIQGIDGLVRCGRTYYGVYNGGSPGTLVSITPDATGLGFEFPFGRGALKDPTQITYDGKRLLIVTNSGWELIGKADSARHGGAQIVAIPIGADCKLQ